MDNQLKMSECMRLAMEISEGGKIEISFIFLPFVKEYNFWIYSKGEVVFNKDYEVVRCEKYHELDDFDIKDLNEFYDLLNLYKVIQNAS